MLNKKMYAISPKYKMDRDRDRSSAQLIQQTTQSTTTTSACGGINSSSAASIRHKRLRRVWGEKKRAGMSFLIVIIFFIVFGLIILTEIVMIEDRSKINSVGNIRHGNSFSRYGESAPDYEDVKEEYSIEEAIMNRNRDFRHNKNIQISLPIPVAPDQQTSNKNAINGGAIPWGALLPPSIEKTLPSFPEHFKPTDGIWKIVNGTRFKFFVFSAFYDRRGGRLIRVIGATKTRGSEKVWCRLWYPNNQTSSNGQRSNTKYRSSTVMARVKIIRENWNLKYSACFILCPLNAPGLDIPYAVSVTSKIRSPPGNILLLRNTDHDEDFTNRSLNDIPDKIGICVKPFHFNYDSAIYLLEFLEMYSILGVAHFVFYNHTLGSRASCVLDHYVNGKIPLMLNNHPPPINNEYLNINNISSIYNNNVTTIPRVTVSMLPWDLRMKSQKEIRTEGLFAALNDCLYRSMYRYKYVALIDLDEFTIPRHNETLNDLLNWLALRINSRNVGAYSFQNAFFYLQFADDIAIFDDNTNNAALRASLITQRKTKRRAKLHPQKQRSKYICKPDAVVEAGNHFVWEFIPGKGSLNVPAEAGILHHYRVCEFGGDDCIKSPSITDRTAHKYMHKLTERVEFMYNYLKEPCNLLNLPPAPTQPPVPRKKLLRFKSNSSSTIQLQQHSSATMDLDHNVETMPSMASTITLPLPLN